MATTAQREKDAPDREQTSIWQYGAAATERAACEHGIEPEADGEILCWDCFKNELEHFPIEEDAADE